MWRGFPYASCVSATSRRRFDRRLYRSKPVRFLDRGRRPGGRGPIYLFNLPRMLHFSATCSSWLSRRVALYVSLFSDFLDAENCTFHRKRTRRSRNFGIMYNPDWAVPFSAVVRDRSYGPDVELKHFVASRNRVHGSARRFGAEPRLRYCPVDSLSDGRDRSLGPECRVRVCLWLLDRRVQERLQIPGRLTVLRVKLHSTVRWDRFLGPHGRLELQPRLLPRQPPRHLVQKHVSVRFAHETEYL